MDEPYGDMQQMFSKRKKSVQFLCIAANVPAEEAALTRELVGGASLITIQPFKENVEHWGVIMKSD